MPCFSSSNYSRTSGFSLLELAIVMMILGILGGAGLPLLKARMTHASLIKTRENQAYVLDALAAFVAHHRRFPCPADPKAVGENYGVEPKERKCQGQKAEGILPFRTLGISERFAKDGFKRLMTYVVDPNLADKEYENKVHIAPGGRLVVKTAQGFPVVAPQVGNSPDFVALVLISHGESGVGAFVDNGQGGKIKEGRATPHKIENLDGNFIFIEGGESDDVLRWETRNNFLKHYVRERMP